MKSKLEDLPLPASSSNKSGTIKFMTSNTTLTTITVAYMVIGIVTTLINKLLLTYSEYKFPYPLFTVLFQLSISFSVLMLWSQWQPIQHPTVKFTFRWDTTIARRTMPLAIVYVCIVLFHPLYLQHVEATNYHFTQSLSIGFSMVFSYLMLQTNYSRHIKSACVSIIIGTCVASMGYINFSSAGAFYGLAWPAMLALYGIYLKKTLLALRHDIWMLVQYNTLLSIVLLTPFVILSGELAEIFSTVWFWDEFGFWLQMLITSIAGLSVNLIMMVLLTYTSPLTLVVAITSKPFCLEIGFNFW
ncbi:GDP-fucose transporter 1 [Choanephora cucurbitarum]|uniref:GDP-fucose transporter 1 n=1 Tax=Choanephora cucurbitarum TaxID=101091 RepID=A0A1C7N245_9FUNG|nr:GDP-fucose transporter 1 [Choanephora cucurbitarum]